MRCLSRYDDRMLWANRVMLIAHAYPHRPLQDQHRLLDRVLVEWCASTRRYRIDEQTHSTYSVFRTRQELAANSRSHLDLWHLLMIDDWHLNSLQTLRKWRSSEIGHDMSRKTTHREVLSISVSMSLGGNLLVGSVYGLLHAIDIARAGIDRWQSFRGLQPPEGGLRDLEHFPDDRGRGVEFLESFGCGRAPPDGRER